MLIGFLRCWMRWRLNATFLSMSISIKHHLDERLWARTVAPRTGSLVFHAWESCKRKENVDSTYNADARTHMNYVPDQVPVPPERYGLKTFPTGSIFTWPRTHNATATETPEPHWEVRVILCYIDDTRSPAKRLAFCP